MTEAVGPGFVLLHFGVPPAWSSAQGLRVVPVLAQADAAGRRRWSMPTAGWRASSVPTKAAPTCCAPTATWRRAGSNAARRAAGALRRAQGFEGAALDAPPPPGTGSARDRLYTRLAQGVSEAGSSRETLFLARLALLLCERLGDEATAGAAIDAALKNLPEPSLSAANATY